MPKTQTAVDAKLVQHFEDEQQRYGTAVAIHNLLFGVASDILKPVGVTGLKVKHDK